MAPLEDGEAETDDETLGLNEDDAEFDVLKVTL